MKVKTIGKVINQKFDEWVSTIEDVDLQEKVKKNSIITGGCIASMLMKEKVNDFDVYFTDLETTKAIAEYYVSRFERKNQNGIPVPIHVDVVDGRVMVVVQSAGVASEDGSTKPYEYFESRSDDSAGEYLGDIIGQGEIEDVYEETQEMALEVDDRDKDGNPSYRPVFMSTNAITLSNRIQLVLRFYGKPEEIHDNYDFVHCTNYWTSKDRKVVLNQKALESLITKELVYVGSKYPVCSVIRLRKFIGRGWTVNAGQILKMVMQINELDLTDMRVLQDQLTGVDAAYFLQLINKLKESDPEKVNAAYLIEIIDRMF